MSVTLPIHIFVIPEVTIHIFQFLERKEIINFSLTCSQLYSYINEIFKRNILIDFEKIPINKLHQVRHLLITGTNIYIVYSIKKYLLRTNNLKELVIKGDLFCPTYFQEKQTSLFFSHSLEKLKISDIKLISFIHLPNETKVLHIRNSSVKINLPKYLEELFIDGFSCINKKDELSKSYSSFSHDELNKLNNAITKLKYLHTLKLSRFNNFKWPQCLKRLILHDDEFNDVKEISDLPQTLEYLEISANIKIDVYPETLKEFIIYFTWICNCMNEIKFPNSLKKICFYYPSEKWIWKKYLSYIPKTIELIEFYKTSYGAQKTIRDKCKQFPNATINVFTMQ